MRTWWDVDQATNRDTTTQLSEYGMMVWRNMKSFYFFFFDCRKNVAEFTSFVVKIPINAIMLSIAAAPRHPQHHKPRCADKMPYLIFNFFLRFWKNNSRFFWNRFFHQFCCNIAQCSRINLPPRWYSERNQSGTSPSKQAGPLSIWTNNKKHQIVARWMFFITFSPTKSPRKHFENTWILLVNSFMSTYSKGM